MPTIKLELPIDRMYEELKYLADELALTLIHHPGHSYQLLPAVQFGFHGISCTLVEKSWCFSREQEATSWEDFLLMHITHRIADKHILSLYYDFGSHEKPIQPTYFQFQTFESYVETVLQNDQGIIRDMKRKWLYDHQKRYMR